jgi:uncharacterized protein HemY
LAWSYEECGEYTPARQAAEWALAQAEQLRSPLGIMWNTNRLGVVALLTGDWPRARTYLERAIDLARETGHVAGYPLYPAPV